jgi:hypothetical protein
VALLADAWACTNPSVGRGITFGLMHGALPLAMGVDAEAFRAGMEIVGCLALPREVFSRPGLAERVTKAAAARGDFRMPGPGRAELLELVSSAGAPAAAG